MSRAARPMFRRFTGPSRSSARSSITAASSSGRADSSSMTPRCSEATGSAIASSRNLRRRSGVAPSRRTTSGVRGPASLAASPPASGAGSLCSRTAAVSVPVSVITDCGRSSSASGSSVMMMSISAGPVRTWPLVPAGGVSAISVPCLLAISAVRASSSASCMSCSSLKAASARRPSSPILSGGRASSPGPGDSSSMSSGERSTPAASIALRAPRGAPVDSKSKPAPSLSAADGAPVSAASTDSISRGDPSAGWRGRET